jgi:ABC-type nitrate/sulfonate/bicarbonate transport system ATPase subunit
MRPILQFDEVSLSFGKLDVLDKLSFQIWPGELVSVLGPSGCGKTSMLNIIAGFQRPTKGVAIVDGREIIGPGPDRGVVFQSYALFDWMTVEQNIAFSLRCAGKSRQEQRRVAERMMELVGLGGFAKSFPYQLSGGMRQRCGLARVLAANPKVMLMDEPFAAVDVQTRETLQEEILRIQAETRCTIVFITHSIEEAVFLGDRIFLMDRDEPKGYAEFKNELPTPRYQEENRLHEDFVQMRQTVYRRMRTTRNKKNLTETS